MTEMIDNVVKVLSDKEHILKRPAMYIGSTIKESVERFKFGKYGVVNYVPGLIKIIDEIIDNSVDEAIRTNFKFANKISVTIKDGQTITITDNGRGIPQDQVELPDGTSVPGPYAAWTITKAGGNFGDDETRKTGGQNGVGSSLTNIFSSRFIGETCDGTNKLIVTCSNGSDNKSWKQVKGTQKGTSVEFTPDFSYFGVNKLSDDELDIIHDRLMTLSVIYPAIEFKLNNKVIRSSFRQYAKQFHEESLVLDTENFSVALCTSEDGFRQQTYVNNIHTKNGGHHIDFFIEELSNFLIPNIKSKYKIEIPRSRIKECLTMVMFIRDMTNLRFDSQTKERFTSTYGEIKKHIDVDFKKLATMFMRNESILMPIIESALARKLAAEKAAETRAAKKASNAKVAKHIKANKSGTSAQTTLILTEGDSALGYLISTRDRDLQGGFPLRGKFINTWGMSHADMMKNKEVFDILAITGLVLGSKAEDTKYHNIAIMTDADVDGIGSIYPSLLAFFSNWPELFEQGRIQFIKTPIIILSKKGQEPVWFYDQESYDNEKDKYTGWDLRYIKGLGSLEETEYERVVKKPVIDVVTLPDDWKDQFELVMGPNPEPRKKWMSE